MYVEPSPGPVVFWWPTHVALSAYYLVTGWGDASIGAAASNHLGSQQTTAGECFFNAWSATAGDLASLDPVQWRLEVSSDNVSWILLDENLDESLMPIQRNSAVDKFMVGNLGEFNESENSFGLFLGVNYIWTGHICSLDD